MLTSFTPLRCAATTLDQLAIDLLAFAPADAGLAWLVTGMFLQCSNVLLYASADIDVRPDGLVARPLAIAPVTTVFEQVNRALPDIRSRASARGYAGSIPDAPADLPAVPDLQPWDGGGHQLAIVVRRAGSATTAHRIACGLLFTAAGGPRLLVASDPHTPALVASTDDIVIDRYLDDCEALDRASYCAMFS